jgi:glycosyltransferase involved in cell wall biosynthesis
MSAPEISFCIPAYNSAATIERCLRAVLAQDAPSREILVVDNASTDDTAARAKKLLDGVPGARVVVNDKNLGRIENWNRCLELAGGRYLKFALTNDVLLPGCAAVLLREANARPGVVIVCSQPDKVEKIPEVLAPMPANVKIKVLDSRGALKHFAKTVNDTGSLNGMLVSMDAVRAHRIRFRPDIPFWSDFHFAGEVAAQGRVVYVDAKSHLFDAGNKARFTFAG